MLRWLRQKFTPNPSTSGRDERDSAAASEAISPLFARALQHEKAGRLDEAISAYEELLASGPDDAAAHGLLGRVLSRKGDLDQALEALSKAAMLDPNATDPLFHLGLLHLKQGNAQASEACFGKILQLDPNNAGAHFGLGKVRLEENKLDAALDHFAAAIARRADYSEAHCNLGVVYEAKGKPANAMAAYRNALAANPDLANAHFNLALLLMKSGDRPGALHHIGKVAALNPGTADAWDIKGRLHHAMGDLESAASAYEQALAIDPNLSEAHNSLGVIHQMLGNYDAAVRSLKSALARRPDNVAARSNLGMALQFMGKTDEAMAALREAANAAPDAAHIHSNYLFSVSHDENSSAEAVFEAHRAFAERFETPLKSQWQPHENDRDPQRRLRIGFVSADLYAHAVATFVEPIWSALDPDQVELWVYANSLNDDHVTGRLKALSHHWRVVTTLSDADLARQIREDRIDILFDLSGHSAGNRLLAFARKPAPIQVTWIGNPNTTGLAAMDYYFADRFAAPPGLLDPLFTEKIVRLAASAVFLPLADAPDVNELPALRTGRLTFGTFARSNKLTAGTIALWSKVLEAVPDSSMVIGSMSDASLKASLMERFARHRIAADRISFQPRMEMRRYLGLHGLIDVALDSYPFGGGTTSCHALWMGVPVLTLAGRTMASRVGATLNGHVELPEFTVETQDAFIEQARYCAGHLPELARLRAELRARTGASALCQPTVVARSLEAAMREMWQLWCKDLPPRSFSAEVDH